MTSTTKFGLRRTALAAAGLLAACTLAQADINVGATLSATGPGASLGIPEKNAIALFPTTIAGQRVHYIVLDDATDTTSAVANTRRLITENKVDLMLGSTVTPNSLAMIDVVAENATPMISLASSARIVEPVDAKRRWVFKTPQSDTVMSEAIAAHMAAAGIRTVAFITFADSFGDGWSAEFGKAASHHGLQVVADERYARTDTSVTAQVLKLMASTPDAVFIAAAGTPAVLPQRTLKDRGYTGKMYQTHGIANADFLRVGGKDVDGTVLPAGPVLVAAQLPAGNPVKAAGLAYLTAYETAYGKGSASTFGAHAWDAGQLLQTAIPVALKAGHQPGTAEFRSDLRDALEHTKDMPGAHGVFTMTGTDHNGLDERSRVMVKIENQQWTYLPESAVVKVVDKR